MGKRKGADVHECPRNREPPLVASEGARGKRRIGVLDLTEVLLDLLIAVTMTVSKPK